MDAPELGNLIVNGELRRDAVHIAVAPVTAAEELAPGQHVGFAPAGQIAAVGAVDAESAVGIVDPFLKAPVRRGQRFWLFLYPNTVTSLRHVWTHPAFVPQPPTRSASANREDWLNERAG